LKKLLIAAVLSISIVIGLAACSTSGSGFMLEDTKWFLSSYGEQGNLISIIDGTEITATFDSAEGRVSMACLSPEGVMEQEQEYLFILSNALSFQADDTTLTIFCSGGLQLYFTTSAGTQ